MSTSPPLPCLDTRGAEQFRSSGSDGASICVSWKSPCPLMWTSLSTNRGQPRTYPETQRVPRPVLPSLLGVNVTFWAKRWERLERNPSFLCLWLPRCLSSNVASCSVSKENRRASGNRASVIFDSVFLDSTLFFTGRSDRPWQTSATKKH